MVSTDITFGQSRCSSNEAKEAASFAFALLSAQKGERTTVSTQDSTSTVFLGRHRETLAGPVYTFGSATGDRRVDVAERGCRVVRYLDEQDRPTTWPRARRIGGRKILVSVEDMKKVFVKVSQERALAEAEKAARQLIGSDVFDSLELRQAELVDQGNSLAYVFRWVREDLDQGLRVGLYVIRAAVNPETGAVYDLQIVRSHPSKTGVISSEAAIASATAYLNGEWGEGNCVFQGGGLTERWPDTRGESQRLWAVVFICQAPGRARRWVSVKVDALTGLPLKKE